MKETEYTAHNNGNLARYKFGGIKNFVTAVWRDEGSLILAL